MTAVLLSRNTTIGGFQLKGHRGGGGFSDVYEAVDPSGQRVAMKILRASEADFESVSARFQRERDLLEQLDSRKVARVVATDLNCATPWIASEFVDGPNLREAVKEKGPMDVADVLALVNTLQTVLEEIHELGISHRDLSANNVLLSPAGPVLIDFGSARVDLDGQIGSILSVGTPFFASPESIRGEPVGAPADVYALARLAQFALTGSEAESFSFVDTFGAEPVWRQLDRCLDPNPLVRPKIDEISVPPTAVAIPSRLTAAAYSAERIAVLPRRFSIATVVLSTLGVGVVIAVGSYLLFSRPELPMTVDRLIDSHPASEVSLNGTSVRTSKGWVKTIPAFPGLTARSINPRDLFKNLKYEAIEAVQMFNANEDQLVSISISTEILRDQLLVSLTEADAENIPLSEHPTARSLIQDAVQDDPLLSPWQCTLIEATHLKRELIDDRVSYLAVVITNPECVTVTGREWTTFIAYRFYPFENGALLIKAKGLRDQVDLRGILALTSVGSRPLVESFPNNEVSLTGITNDDFRAPLTGFDDTSSTPFLKRAWRVPGKRSLLLTYPTTDEAIADISMVAIANPVDPAWTGELSDLITPLGSLSNISGGFRFRIANPTDNEWIVVFELEETWFGSVIDFTLSDAGKVENVERLLTLNDLSAGVEPVVDYLPSSGFFVLQDDTNTKFLLPEPIPRLSEGDQKIDIVQLNGVDLPVKRVWNQIPSSAHKLGPLTAFNRNPIFDIDITGLEVDSPHLEVATDAVADVLTRQGGEAWLATDRYQHCLGRKTYSENDGAVYFEFRVYSMCAVPTKLSNADNPKLRLQRAPIVEFQLSTKFAPSDWEETWAIEVFRGRFVPRFAIDLDYWAKFVSSVKLQFSKIEEQERLRCERTFSGWSNFCLRP